MNFELPDLPYAYDALEPHLDARTMEIHHGKHHAGYTNNLNTLCAENGVEATIEEILDTISTLPVGIRNNAGGFYNHSLFWSVMTPEQTRMSVEMESYIVRHFGTVDDMKTEFDKAATGQFGSGWAWLCSNAAGEMKIIATANQDNPLMDVVREQEGEWTPILGLDVWEHAYYLHYQNRRPDYIDAWWNVVDWGEVERRYNDIQAP